MADQETYGVAVVGAGAMGQVHMTSLQGIPWLRVVAVADRDESRAAEQAERFGAVAWSRDFDEVVSRPDVDVVFVCVPTAFHAEVAVEAARNGKHVFCEKPLALTVADGERMIRAASQGGVKLAVNFCHRFQKANIILRRRLDDGAIERPVFHTVQQAAEVRPKAAMNDDRLNRGPVMDVLCHFVDAWRFLFRSEPVRVFARGAIFATGKPRAARVRELALDTAVVTVEFASGDVGCFHVCWGLPEGKYDLNRFTVVAPNALIEMESYARMVVTGGGGAREVVEDLATEADREHVKLFAKVLRDGGRLSTTGEDGPIALQVSLAAFESIKTGEAVTLAS